MKAFIFRRTTKKALVAPTTAPTPSAIASEIGATSQTGVKVMPRPTPDFANRMPMTIAASAMTDSTERSMYPAMISSDSPIASVATKVDCSTMLAKMPIWK